MKISKFLLEIISKKETKIGRILDIFSQLLDEFLLPVIIGGSIIGAVYSLWLGIQYARSDGDARKEAQKRIINFIIGIVCLIVLFLLLQIYALQAESLINWLETSILSKSVNSK